MGGLVSFSRWIIIAVVSLTLAAVTGLIALTVRSGDATAGWVFAVATLPCWIGLAQVALTPGTADPHEHPEDNVERQWWARAAEGAFLDLVTTLGVSTFITALGGLDSLPSVVFLAVAMVDVTGRFLLLRHHQG